MSRKIDITYNSENDSKGKKLQLASGYISETNILFEKESIAVYIQAKGHVGFYNIDDERLADFDLPAVEAGRQVYEEVCCSVEGEAIILEFPLYKWIDNYPHCDGEHDRWDTREIDRDILKFDFVNKKII